jgi:hypothetical protein
MEVLHYVFPVEHCFLQYTNLLLATGMKEHRTEFFKTSYKKPSLGKPKEDGVTTK